jgi:hypothetical protein
MISAYIYYTPCWKSTAPIWGGGERKRMKEEKMSINWRPDDKEKRCKECGCNLIITRKYRFFTHNRGKTYHICLDCNKECEVEWVDIEDFTLGQDIYQITKSTRYEKLLYRIKNLRNILHKERKYLDGILERSLDD